MKFVLKFLAPAAALLLASTASADVTVRLTGSTAFRGGTVTAIKNIMTFGAGQGYAYTGSSFTGSSNHIFVGSVSGISGVVTVKCTWSGAVAGVKALNNNDNVSFLQLNTAGSPSGTGTVYTLSSTGTASVNTDNLDDSSTADIAMTDNLQGSTKYTSNPLTANKVGIIPFAWVASKDAPAALTNITPQNAQALYKVGFASASIFTNNNADAMDQVGGTAVFAAGRDPLSGTRLCAFAESGVGIFQSVQQWRAISVTGSTVNTIGLTLADAAVDAPNPGENGFTSGGNLADLLRNNTTSVTDVEYGYSGKACFIGYLGEGDAARAVNGTGSTVAVGTNVGCRYLSYNGVNAFGGTVKTVTGSVDAVGNVTVTTGDTTGLVVGQLVRSSGLVGDSTIASITDGTHFAVTNPANAAYTVGSGLSISTSNLLPKPIWNGTYTFWGYEYIMWRQSLAGDKLTFGNALKTQIHDVDYFTAGLSEASMRVVRSSDGGTVTQNY